MALFLCVSIIGMQKQTNQKRYIVHVPIKMQSYYVTKSIQGTSMAMAPKTSIITRTTILVRYLNLE